MRVLLAKTLTLSLRMYRWRGIQTDRDGNPNVFNLNSDGAKLKLNGNNAKPSNRWNANNKFMFLLRKSFLFWTHLCPVFLFGIVEALFPCAEPPSRFFELHTDGFKVRI